MIAALRKPARRIAIALVVSVILHGLVMWAPDMRVPHRERVLPPLTARLEPLMLPPPAPPSVPKPKTQEGPARAPKVAAEPAPLPQPEPMPEPVPMEQDAPVAAGPAAEPVPPPSPEPPVVETAVPVRPHELPKHAQLDFAVYQGSAASFMIGEIHHTLDIADGRYELKAETKTVGLANFFKRYSLVQSSRGTADEAGLHPEYFEEEKYASGSTQKVNATFDWTAQIMHFSQGGDAELPAGAQDILSMLYQLPLYPMNREIIPLTISNGRKLEKYELEIGQQEVIDTPMGKLRALHLRKLHNQGEEGLEIWLGLEYRLLPVKVRHLDRDGEVDGEALVTRIGVSDEPK